jgi:hypothetical protein
VGSTRESRSIKGQSGGPILRYQGTRIPLSTEIHPNLHFTGSINQSAPQLAVQLIPWISFYLISIVHPRHTAMMDMDGDTTEEEVYSRPNGAAGPSKAHGMADDCVLVAPGDK